MKKIFISFFSVAIGCVGVANADVYTWNGAAGDNMWGNSRNWDLNNGYYPQSNSDTAIIRPGNEVIVWSSTQQYLGATASIELGAGNTVRFEANSTAVDLNVSSFTLGGNSMFKLFGSNAIGYGKNLLSITERLQRIPTVYLMPIWVAVFCGRTEEPLHSPVILMLRGLRLPGRLRSTMLLR